MSVKLSSKTYLIPTELGTFTVKHRLIAGYDVEDVVRAKSESQAQLVAMVNLGQEVQQNSSFPVNVLPTVFKDVGDEGLQEDR